MTELYVCTGLYAEGRTDYRFLLPLLDRLLDDLLARHFTARYILASTHPIDAPPPEPKPRDLRISAAIDDNWDRCTLFVVHSDGGGDPVVQRRDCIEPGISAARSIHADCSIAPCVPVRETEAWMLVDPEVFAQRLGTGPHDLPSEPERVTDPKLALKTIFTAAKSSFSGLDYAFFGEQVQLAALRRLTAFQEFESNLVEALHHLAAVQGVT